MLKICVVGVYFGRLPNYFNLWLKSARINNTIDFVIFTNEEYEDLPENVQFVKFTIEELQKLASSKLGFEVCLERPYKCCDFKPAYGLLFEDYLKGYDYWGHCDFDLIWGDLRGFFDKYHLEQYDKFLPLGHLNLYRNTPENNRRFMLNGSRISYKTVFTHPQNYAFDETSGIYQIFKKNGFRMFDERIFADISKIYHRFRLAMNDKNYNYQIFCWEDGHIYRYYLEKEIKRDEFLYIHFKERGALFMANGCVNTDSFYITNQGFFPCCTTDIDKNIIQKYNYFESESAESKELKKFSWMEKKENLIAKINKIVFKKEKIR